MENSKEKMILAVLSQCVTDRDRAAFSISSILAKGHDSNIDNVSILKDEFFKHYQAEITIESIQLYYAKNFKLKEEEKENDNNS